MRYLGFCPEDLDSVLCEVARYVSQQVDVPADALASYPGGDQTRTDHLRRVYEHLGFRRFSRTHAREVFG